MAFRDGLEHRHALGADGQAIGRVLDVAATDDLAVLGFQRRADLEMREGREGVPPRGPGRGKQMGHALALSPPTASLRRVWAARAPKPRGDSPSSERGLSSAPFTGLAAEWCRPAVHGGFFSPVNGAED